MNHLTTATLRAMATLAFTPLALAQFGPATTVPTGSQPDTTAIGDFDGNGIVDLAITTGVQGGISLSFGLGGGTYAAAVPIFVGDGSGSAAIHAVDFDGDTDLDLAVSLKGVDSVQVLFNSGAGTFTAGPLVPTGARPAYMAAGDLDGDLDIDLVTSNRDSNDLTVLLNDGAGGFSVGGTLTVGVDPRVVVAVDLNGDTLADLAVTCPDDRNVDVLMNMGGATFAASTSYSVGAGMRPDGIAAVDVDGDTDMDLAVSTSGVVEFVSIFMNTGGTLSGPFSYPTGGLGSSSVVAGDFDLDGDQDVAVANVDSSDVSFLANSGAGAFGAPSLFAVGLNPNHLATGDLDGNGSMDLVTANTSADSASVLLNQDSGVGVASCFGVGCPCGNDDPTAGCATSTGSGAMLSGTGTSSVAADDLVLDATGLPTSSQGLFYMGDAQVMNPFFDGKQCALGNSFRFLDQIQNSGAAGTMSLTTAVASSGMITTGSTWHFHCWFRDPGTPCGTGANLSSLYSVTFTP